MQDQEKKSWYSPSLSRLSVADKTESSGSSSSSIDGTPYTAS